MKPRPLILIDTHSIGGAGAVILQGLKNGTAELCEPRVAGFWRGAPGSEVGQWQFREAVEALGVPFSTLRQKHGFDTAAVGEARRLVREHGINLLESHGYKAHLVCMALKALTGLPWVGFVHGWTSENSKVEFYNLLDKSAVRFADRILPVSESLKKRLKLGPLARRKAVVLANAAAAVDTGQNFVDRRAQYGIGADELLVTVVGRFSPEKGHRYFVEAMKTVCAAHPRARALLVGEGQERGRLEQQIRDLGLERRFVLVGYQEEVSSFYHASDVVCLPSLSEGMPNAALEAMMFAKPVVATSVGGIPEVVQHGITGSLVPSQNPEALAAALGAQLADAGLRGALGDAGKKRVETEFDARARVRKLVKIYESLLGA